MLSLVGAVLLVIGSIFLFLGCLGLVRMPDTFNRIQAGTKTTTLGTLFTLAGAACLAPAWGWTLLLIGVFLIFTNPISSQVLASTAHNKGSRQTPLAQVDRLQEDEDEPEILS